MRALSLSRLMAAMLRENLGAEIEFGLQFNRGLPYAFADLLGPPEDSVPRLDWLRHEGYSLKPVDDEFGPPLARFR